MLFEGPTGALSKDRTRAEDRLAPGDRAPPWEALPGDVEPLVLCLELLAPGDLQARTGGNAVSVVGRGFTKRCTDSVKRLGRGRPGA